ncbi:borealin-like [Babylonia areolata]|uniref:borealin-like n=1 Tax=Babylonia areolata TaxID=304850 RepID=UPI003FD5DCE9
MPRRRATRIKKHTKPKKPEDDIGDHLDPEERRHKLGVFLQDFDMEVNQRLRKIESEKIRIQSVIEKELNLQLSYIPVEIRDMNIMDFIAAGGTVENAMVSLQTSRKDSLEQMEATQGVRLTSKKTRGLRKGKGTDMKSDMPPPSSTMMSTRKQRSRFQTPLSRQLPAVWDTPAVTPKFDVNLPFTPGIARAPKQGERLMSLAGSPVDLSTTQRATRTLKHTVISEEEDLENAVSRLAAMVPQVSTTDIHKFLSDFSTAKKGGSSSK